MVAMQKKALLEQREEMLKRGEQILAKAKKEDRDLTKAEMLEIDDIYGDDVTGVQGKLTEIDAQIVQLQKQERVTNVAMSKRLAKGVRHPDGHWLVPPSDGLGDGGGATMRSSTGEEIIALSSTDKYANHAPHSMADGSDIDTRYPLGEFIKASICGVNRHTPNCVKMAQSTTVNPHGGFLVPSEFEPGVIDLARASSVMIQAGTQTFIMQTSDLTLANIESDPTFTIKAENDAFPDASMTFGSRKLSAYTIGCVIPASRELAEDAPNFAAMVVQAIGRAMGAELDRLALRGTGSAQPKGLLNYLTGDYSTTQAGANIAWEDVGNAAISVAGRNYEASSAVFSPSVHGYLQQTQTGDGTNSAANWLNRPPTLENVTFYQTTNMTSTDAIVGDFSMMAWGLRQGALVELTTTGGDSFKKHQVLIKITWRGDFLPLDVKAFQRVDTVTIA